MKDITHIVGVYMCGGTLSLLATEGLYLNCYFENVKFLNVHPKARFDGCVFINCEMPNEMRNRFTNCFYGPKEKSLLHKAVSWLINKRNKSLFMEEK